MKKKPQVKNTFFVLFVCLCTRKWHVYNFWYFWLFFTAKK